MIWCVDFFLLSQVPKDLTTSQTTLKFKFEYFTTKQSSSTVTWKFHLSNIKAEIGSEIFSLTVQKAGKELRAIYFGTLELVLQQLFTFLSF